MMACPKQSLPARRKDSDGGFAIVVVIWAIGLLSLLALTFVYGVRSQLLAASNAVEGAVAAALADAGIALAVEVGTPARFACRLEGVGILHVEIEDEFGKVDLNMGDERLLAALLVQLGVARATAANLVDRLVDFRDSDNLRRANGAEARDYAALGLRYGPKNAAFDVVDELGQVPGFGPQLLARLRPHVTVHSGATGLDLQHTSDVAIRSAMIASGAPLAAMQQGPDALRMHAQMLLLPEFKASSHTRALRARVVARTNAGAVFRKSMFLLREAGERNFHRHLSARVLIDANDEAPISERIVGGLDPC